VTPKVEQLVECAPERTISRALSLRRSRWIHLEGGALITKSGLCTRRQIDSRLIDLLPVLTRYAPPAAIFDKIVCSAFGNPQFHQHLRGRQIDTLIISGSETDVFVMSSTIAGVDYG
jgi:nicotinamidase-related amidase